MDIDLTGKVAVVTGSGRGLGLAYATALARAGAAVVVNDIDGKGPRQPPVVDPGERYSSLDGTLTPPGPR